MAKTLTCDFLGHYSLQCKIKCDKQHTLHAGATHQALPIHTTFSDLEYSSRSQQCQTALTEILTFLYS